jgi:hypothetical protein
MNTPFVPRYPNHPWKRRATIQTKERNTIMSSKRESANETQQHLQTAEKYLQHAEKSAQNTGDTTLHQTVKKLREDTSKTHTDITRKLDNHSG